MSELKKCPLLAMGILAGADARAGEKIAAGWDRCGGMPAHGADLPDRIAKLEAVAKAADHYLTWGGSVNAHALRAALAAWKEGK